MIWGKMLIKCTFSLYHWLGTVIEVVVIWVHHYDVYFDSALVHVLFDSTLVSCSFRFDASMSFSDKPFMSTHQRAQWLIAPYILIPEYPWYSEYDSGLTTRINKSACCWYWNPYLRPVYFIYRITLSLFGRLVWW